MKKESIGKKVICIILALILALLILVSKTVAIIQGTILNKDYLIKVMEKTDSYSQMQKDIEDSIYNYIMQANIEKSQIEDIISQEKIKNDLDSLIKSVYQGKKVNINDEVIKTEVDKRLNDILVSNGNMTLTEESKKSIEEFSKNIAQTYSENINPLGEIIDEVGDTINVFNQKVDEYKIYVYIITAVMFVIVTLTCITQKERMIRILNRYQAIALIISGALLMLPSCIVKLKVKMNDFFIVNDAISNMIKYIVNDLEKNFLLVGIALVIVGCIVSFIGNLSKREKENK